MKMIPSIYLCNSLLIFSKEPATSIFTFALKKEGEYFSESEDKRIRFLPNYAVS
jgi:hypothetical protein